MNRQEIRLRGKNGAEAIWSPAAAAAINHAAETSIKFGIISDKDTFGGMTAAGRLVGPSGFVEARGDELLTAAMVVALDRDNPVTGLTSVVVGSNQVDLKILWKGRNHIRIMLPDERAPWGWSQHKLPFH